MERRKEGKTAKKRFLFIKVETVSCYYGNINGALMVLLVNLFIIESLLNSS